MAAHPSLRALAGQCRAVVRDALDRGRAVRAWELLQERDAEGHPRGPLPYTPQAMAELAAAHQCDPDDIALVHDLAIAQHALAWDLELANDPGAADAWERALGLWRRVATAGPFWAALREKYIEAAGPPGTGSPPPDTAWLDTLSRDLLEHLLDIHVQFIRHYCEQNQPDRAARHVRIVQQARIHAVLKVRMTGKVFQAMTASVPEARQHGDHSSAIEAVERFLALFPDHLPALRLHVELVRDRLETLSFQTEWGQITALAARAYAWAGRMAAHPDLPSDALASAALVELATQVARAAHDRGAGRVIAATQDQDVIANRDSALEAFDLACAWGRLAIARCPSGASLPQLLAIALRGRAVCLDLQINELIDGPGSVMQSLPSAVRLCREAVAALREACQHDRDADLAAHLTESCDRLSMLESLQHRAGLLREEERP